MIDPVEWKLAFDEFGTIIVVPVENPLAPQYGEPPWNNQADPGNDPEHERSVRAGLAHS